MAGEDKMPQQPLLKLIAWLLIMSGAILIFGLDAWLEKPAELPLFDQVERRIPGGAVLGAGLFVLKLPPLRPKLPLLASAIYWLTAGALVGRVVGLIFIQGQSPRQWMWVGIELVVIWASQRYLKGSRKHT